MSITPTGAVFPSAQTSLSAQSRGAADSGFTISGAHAASHQPPAASLASPVSNAAAMLALQEQAGGMTAQSADVADREGRRHGQAMLEALATIQKALLTDADPAAALARLTDLANAHVPACDPALARILSSIRLRAKLELLRHTSPGTLSANGS